MSSSYSVINDLYGVESRRQEREPRSHWGLIMVLAVAALFLYESVHPVMRLRSNPPSEFVNVTANRKAPVQVEQEVVARSYWNIASEFASGKYAYGDALPVNPPADFALSSDQDYATRALYWHRFREMWNEQAAWVTAYQFNTDWMDDGLDSLRGFVRDRLSL